MMRRTAAIIRFCRHSDPRDGEITTRVPPAFESSGSCKRRADEIAPNCRSIQRPDAGRYAGSDWNHSGLLGSGQACPMPPPGEVGQVEDRCKTGDRDSSNPLKQLMPIL